MKWINLKSNKCPMCDKDFMQGLKTRIATGESQIYSHPCGFQISEKRFKEIVNSQVNQKLEREYEESLAEDLKFEQYD